MVIRVSIRIVGINRSLSYTAGSISTQLIEPLRKCRFTDLDTSIFLIQPSGSFNNPRSGESGLLEGVVPQSLNVERVVVVPEGVLLREASHFYGNALELADTYGDDGRSVRNAIVFGQALMREAEQIQNDVDIVIFARPDIVYMGRLFVLWRVITQYFLRKLGRPPTLLTPSWGNFGGINDRFAIISPDLVPRYFGRLNYVKSFPEASSFSSETFLAHAMDGTRVKRKIYTPMVRVRIGGRFEPSDVVLHRGKPMLKRLTDWLIGMKAILAGIFR